MNPGQTKAVTPRPPPQTSKSASAPAPSSPNRMRLLPDFCGALFGDGRTLPLALVLEAAFDLPLRVGLSWMAPSSSLISGTKASPQAGHLIFLPAAGRALVFSTLAQ